MSSWTDTKDFGELVRFIRHIIEPKRLLLIWQAPSENVRKRFVVGELIKLENEVCLRYLAETEDFAEALEHDFKLYPAYKPNPNRLSDELCEGVMDMFARRLPPRTRGDFSKYLENFRIPTNVEISDFALLGYTGAKLPTDGFSIVHPFDTAHGEFEFLMEAAGFRHMSELPIDELTTDMSAVFEFEQENPVDPNAIAIKVNNKKIGYVPRALLPTFSRWLHEGSVKAQVERLNGRQGSPVVYLFVEVSI